MTTSGKPEPVGTFGTGEFEFGSWITPFTNDAVDIIGVTYDSQGASELVARVHVLDANTTYRVAFSRVSATRLLDESGLVALWEKTAERKGRPGQTTFRVRNHAWTVESVICFLASDGWSFVIASDTSCLEVVSDTIPEITRV